MPRNFVALINDAENLLQDSSNTLFSASDLGEYMENAITELSGYDPHLTLENFKLESRNGTASSTTAGSLVDATETQFLSTDVDKVIHNLTSNTWAIVTAFTSTSILVLSKDIMVSGDNYEMFNQDSRTVLEIYIGGVIDWIGDDHGIEWVEYPIQKKINKRRNFSIEGEVLKIDYGRSIPNSQTTSNILDVGVWINRRHQVSQLTGLLGALTAGAAEGATSIAVDGLTGTEVVAENTELTIAGLRGVYRVTDSGGVTLSSGAGTLAIFPPIESAVDNNDVVTFKESTLNPSQERLVSKLCAGRALVSKGNLFLQNINNAKTEVDLMNVETDLGKTALASGLSLINTVNVGGPDVPGQYQRQAQADALIAREGYAAGSQNFLLLVERARNLELHGQRMVDDAIDRMKRLRGPNQTRNYSRW